MKIKEAAIFVKDIHKVFTGKNHAEIINTNYQDGINFKNANTIQGFVTDGDIFVDRQKAVRIAFKAGQIKKKKKTLFSEDLF